MPTIDFPNVFVLRWCRRRYAAHLPPRLGVLFRKYLLRCWRIRRQQQYMAQIASNLRNNIDKDLKVRLTRIYGTKEEGAVLPQQQ
jgi:hypothetical protein